MASHGRELDASIGPEQAPHGRSADIMVEWDPVETDGVPSARKGSAMGVWNNQPLLFGGDGGRGVRYNDVFLMDTESMRWKEVCCQPSLDGYFPPPLSYHAMVVWRHFAVVFGGYDDTHTNDVRLLNLLTMTWTLARVRGDVPSKRYGHTMCLWGDQAIVMGGQTMNGGAVDDMFVLNLETMTWREVSARGNGPPASCYHTMTVWKDTAFTFGGNAETDVFLLDLPTMVWRRITPDGDGPSKRFGHTAAVWHDLAVIVCGRHGTMCNADVYVLSLGHDSMMWLPFSIDGSFVGERHAHSMVVIGAKAYVVGGHGGTYYNDTQVLRLDIMAWMATSYTPDQRDGHVMFIHNDEAYLWGGDGGGGRRFQDLSALNPKTNRWRRVTQSGDVPSARSYHAIARWTPEKLLLFGGFDHSYCDDLYELDLTSPEEPEWRRLETGGDQPMPRYGHSFTTVGSRAYLFGGKGHANVFFGNELEVLDLDTLTWSVLETSGEAPARRYGQCAFVYRNVYYVVGGSGVEFYNDVHALDLETRTWSRVKTHGRQPSVRSYHSVALWGAKAVVFGGDHGGGERFNDVHILDLRSMRWLEVVTKGPIPAVRCTHTFSIVGSRGILFGGRDAGTYYNDVRYLNLDPGVSAVADLFCTIRIIIDNGLTQELARTTENHDLLTFLDIVSQLPSELVLLVCSFSIEFPPTRMPSDAILDHHRAAIPSPLQNHAAGLSSIIVSVCEYVYGDLNDISKTSFKGCLVKDLLARIRTCIITNFDLPTFILHKDRVHVTNFLKRRMDEYGQNWDKLGSAKLTIPRS
ncbi:acyl-CoA binding protein [Thecamonas trahens ATCC 50062]|uniref:Acyl-CoA binding protein n=1 Tax=Thecamonas trahens ATCC 50062 TaxID=461836 RepID=A0A0L0DAB4_THETB|nr:acyl-CoA binding protein [Thecamonas trahens ATCC 50062]KNC49026.1 acyl-CoA binding protein [Thecamonas trahens ATCC 50062]|eukprot:XP_013758436.1 acyl-CoA binding protein [Thecamonas trahens ATCC 50062]